MNIQLWDIPGHERFGGLTRVHYKYAHGALIVFDLSRPEETFDTALSWLSDVTQKLFDERPNEEEAGDDDAVRDGGQAGRQAGAAVLLTYWLRNLTNIIGSLVWEIGSFSALLHPLNEQ